MSRLEKLEKGYAQITSRLENMLIDADIAVRRCFHINSWKKSMLHRFPVGSIV